jgi:hypothetical protein
VGAGVGVGAGVAVAVGFGVGVSDGYIINYISNSYVFLDRWGFSICKNKRSFLQTQI